MGKVTFEIIENYKPDAVNYKNIGRAMKLTNGIYDVIVTLDVGPRIMHYSLCGQPNMLNDDCALVENMPDGKV